MVTAIIQARVNSTRLPGKVLKDLNGRSVLEFMIERINICQEIDNLVIATTINNSDDPIYEIGKYLKIPVVRGSENDVLSRFHLVSELYDDEIYIRLTGDCPLIDPNIITKCIQNFQDKKVDFLSNCDPPTYPDGLDVEIFSKQTLIKANKLCNDVSEREHVTLWMLKNKDLKIGLVKNDVDYSKYRWTVDEKEDLDLVRKIVDHFDGSSKFSWLEVIKLFQNNPSLSIINSSFTRNEGITMNTGQKLWRRSKKLIPGGNMLLSKRSEMFLPEKWPSYFSKAQGCSVWDLDGNEFIDMSIMGIGTNILGYGQPEVDLAVSNTISNGNMSTLNCPEEVWLAEKLVELHPWSDMVRFARTGGEANAIAIRIARAASNKDTVAICGYHGWHDWYLATNLKDDSNLEEHLLPGLEPNGVPSNLIGTVKPFSFNRLDQIEKIASENELGAIKLEVQRSTPPSPGFLEGIRNICNKKNIVLIFDECTSGFRETFGGIHKKYEVEPDIAIFGKALGNGYAITAIIGKRNIMDCAQNTFISSTFWTERIGPSAAIKTLEVMEREKSWEKITLMGEYIREQWKKIADQNNLKISFNGIPSIGGFSFSGVNSLKYKTLISQEMLKKGYLASTLCYVSVVHTKEIVDQYIKNLNDVFELISKCEQDILSIDDLIEGPICHDGFKRLN